LLSVRALIGLFAIGLIVCMAGTRTTSAAVYRGNRILGMDIGPTEAGTDDPITLAQTTFGVQAAHLMLKWTDIEVAPGVYDGYWLDAINRAYPPRGMKVHLSINPIDARNKHMPPDLKPLGFDHPLVIYRLCEMLNFAFSRMPDVTFVGFGIGNVPAAGSRQGRCSLNNPPPSVPA